MSFIRMGLGTVLIAALCLLWTPGVLAAQARGSTGGAVRVNVRLPDGTSLDSGALVNLTTMSGGSMGIGQMRGGQVDFEGLPAGRYTLEVLAPGYQKVTQQVELAISEERLQVYVTLQPTSAGNPASPQHAGAPILAPGAQKELSKALDALRENKLEEAKKHLDKLNRKAPANPDANYLLGMYFAQTGDWARARSQWEKAIQIYPQHAFSLVALAQMETQNGNFPAAIAFLARAVDASPSSWRFEQRLAEAYLLHGELEQAQRHAEHAVELGKDRAIQCQLIIAKVYLQRNESQRAQRALNTFLTQQPSGPGSEEAVKLLEFLKQPASASVAPAPAASGGKAELGKPAPATAFSIREALLPPAKWMPPDVDESMPAVESTAACPLQKVRDEAAKRVRDFVEAVNRVSATESLEHEVIDRFGLTAKRETRAFSYVEFLQEIEPGMYRAAEYRNGTMGLDVFPERLASLGLGSLVMIFHPAYRDEYEVTCEGLSRWHGALAWQVHFRQRSDKPSRLREYSVAKQVFPVSLRGRAWVATNSYQIVSLETDLVAPIPQIRLKAEHVSIDYAPVKFRKGNEELWLPQNAELFFDLGGRRIHRRHHFGDYRLFSVDEKQSISAPPSEAELNPATPSPQPNF